MSKESVFGNNYPKQPTGPTHVLRADMGFTPHPLTLAALDAPNGPLPRMLPELPEGLGENLSPEFRRLK
jgi:hypothetical protein